MFIFVLWKGRIFRESFKLWGFDCLVKRREIIGYFRKVVGLASGEVNVRGR